MTSKTKWSIGLGALAFVLGSGFGYWLNGLGHGLITGSIIAVAVAAFVVFIVDDADE